MFTSKSKKMLLLSRTEDQQLCRLPVVAKVSQSMGMLSTVTANFAVKAAFPLLFDTAAAMAPSVEEWQTLSQLVLNRIPLSAIRSEESAAFTAFIGQPWTGGAAAPILARYLTLYLPSDTCPLHVYWPKVAAHDVLDRRIKQGRDAFLQQYPTVDAALLVRCTTANGQMKLHPSA